MVVGTKGNAHVAAPSPAGFIEYVMPFGKPHRGFVTRTENADLGFLVQLNACPDVVLHARHEGTRIQ